MGTNFGVIIVGLFCFHLKVKKSKISKEFVSIIYRIFQNKSFDLFDQKSTNPDKWWLSEKFLNQLEFFYFEKIHDSENKIFFSISASKEDEDRLEGINLKIFFWKKDKKELKIIFCNV